MHDGASKRKREGDTTEAAGKRNRLTDFAVIAVSLMQ